MEANELMIGDWVLGKKKKPIKVEIINDNDKCINEVYCQGDIVDEVSEEDIEPIPLTPEVLEKNGFEEYRDGVYQLLRYRIITETDTVIIEPMKIESRLGSKWYWFSNKDREMAVVKPRMVYPFTCVHELQHALRLCGLNDLADNFKIE